jgi:hypothetical protein
MTRDRETMIVKKFRTTVDRLRIAGIFSMAIRMQSGHCYPEIMCVKFEGLCDFVLEYVFQLRYIESL